MSINPTSSQAAIDRTWNQKAGEVVDRFTGRSKEIELSNQRHEARGDGIREHSAPLFTNCIII